MDTLNRLKRDIKRLVASNLGNALKKLGQALDESGDNYNTCISLQAEFNRVKQQSISGGLTPTEESTYLSRVVNRFLDFVDSLEGEDIRPAFQLQEEIYDRILVVCKEAQRVPYLQRFFPEAFFKGVAYLPSDEEPEPEPDPESFDIVIFDNHPHDSDNGEHALLKDYLSLGKPRLLYFGQTLPLLYNYPEKAYFANSIFSLHARLEEMLTFLKYYNYED